MTFISTPAMKAQSSKFIKPSNPQMAVPHTFSNEQENEIRVGGAAERQPFRTGVKASQTRCSGQETSMIRFT